MTTNRKPMTGRGQSDYSTKLDSYNKDSKSKSVGRFMRTFARTKTSRLVTAWNDDDYFIVINQLFYWLGDATGSVDIDSVPSAQAMNIMNDTWEIMYSNANLKDLVEAEETSWKRYYCAAAFICFAQQVQYNYRCYLPAYTEADSTPGSADGIPYFSQSSFDIFNASMKDIPIPKGIYELVDTFVSWIVQIAQPYEQFTLRIPGSFVFPFNSYYDLADLEAARSILKAHLGNATTHAKKFGMKFGTWRDPVKPTVKTLTDPDVLAYFNHSSVYYTDQDPVAIELWPNGGFHGDNSTTDYTNTEYLFKDTPNESALHVLASFFGTYDATHNKYGGLILTAAAAATEYYTNMSHCSQHGTATSKINFNDEYSARLMMMLFKATTDNNVQDGEFSIAFYGASFTAIKATTDCWMLDLLNGGLFMGKSRGKTETDNDLLNYIGRLLV